MKNNLSLTWKTQQNSTTRRENLTIQRENPQTEIKIDQTIDTIFHQKNQFNLFLSLKDLILIRGWERFYLSLKKRDKPIRHVHSEGITWSIRNYPELLVSYIFLNSTCPFSTSQMFVSHPYPLVSPPYLKWVAQGKMMIWNMAQIENALFIYDI